MRLCGVVGIIADKLHNVGWSLGWLSAIDSDGRTIWNVDAHRHGKRFIVRADEKLTAFVELELTLVRNAVNQAYQAKPYMKIR
jgi:hypothetical protein